jgi:hypothetical protein
MVAGGSTNDPAIVSTAGGSKPLAVLINYGGLYRWAKYFSNSLNSFSAMIFSKDYTKAIGAFDTIPLTFVVLNSLDGTIINSYKDSGGGGTIV